MGQGQRLYIGGWRPNRPPSTTGGICSATLEEIPMFEILGTLFAGLIKSKSA